MQSPVCRTADRGVRQGALRRRVFHVYYADAGLHLRHLRNPVRAIGQAPERCPICDEDRQYVPPSGQAWTTHDVLDAQPFQLFPSARKRSDRHRHDAAFAIGQRALLLATDSGNVLWDCISLLDQATVAIVKALGGLIGIAISHPHYYASMVEWAHAFDAPIHLHAERPPMGHAARSGH